MNNNRGVENIIVKPFMIRHKVALILTAKIIIAMALLFYIIIRINPDEIIMAITGANLYFIAFALLLLIPNIFSQYWKWMVISDKILGISDRKIIVASLFFGISAGSFTPARVGEYFGRAIYFKNNSVTDVTVATFIDKTFTLILIAFIGALASIIFIHYYYNVTVFISASLFIFVFALSFIFLYLVLNPSIWKDAIINKFRFSKWFSAVLRKITVIKKLDKNISYRIMFISLLFFACILLQYALLVAAFSHHFYLLNYVWAGVLLFFTKSIIPPVSIADLGIREAASVFFISMFGESSSVGFNAAIFLFLINILLPAIAGLFFLFQKNNG